MNEFIEVKKSKFYSYIYNINSENDINDILNDIKSKNKKAKHIVYAYKIGNIERKIEDKEPSGTAGSQILNIIHLKKLDNILIIVVRYFGGTLLGIGPLSKAYRDAVLNLFK